MSEGRRRRTSDIWNYFEIVGSSTASCNMCKSVLSFKSTNSNLRKHIERKHVLVLDHLVPTEKLESCLSEEHADAAETNSLPEPSSPSEPAYDTIYAESLSGKDFSDSSDSEYLPDGESSCGVESVENLPAEQRAPKKVVFKRPYKEQSATEDETLVLNTIIDPKNGSKRFTKSLQDLADTQVISNNLKEQQLSVEKNRNEIFSHFLTIFKNMTEKCFPNQFSRGAAGAASAYSSSVSPSASLSVPLSFSRNLDVDEDRPMAFKHPRMRDSINNDNPDSRQDVNWLTDLEIEEKKIEIDERRLKLEERKVIMEGQMEERKIAMVEKKFKLDKQNLTSEDQPEERNLEIDEAQMKLNEQKLMLEVQIEEKKLEIDEKRLKLEKRKVFLMEQKKMYSRN